MGGFEIIQEANRVQAPKMLEIISKKLIRMTKPKVIPPFTKLVIPLNNDNNDKQ